jgi:hypothetical protein
MKLILPDQEPPFGFFTEPIEAINYQDYSYRHPLGRKVSAWRKNLAFKQFQFFGISSEEWIIGCAIANLKYVTAAFYYRYHIPTRDFYHFSCKQPFNFKAYTDVNPDQGEWRLTQNKNSFNMYTHNQTRKLDVHLSHGEYISLSLHEHHTDPLRLCTRTGMNGWTYTQKNAGLIVSGELSCSLGKTDLRHALGQHDWSAGFMRRETFWNWASLNGRNSEHSRDGLNVSAGVNETSYSENCYWLEGKRYPLSNVNFIYSRQNLMAPWEIGTQDGRLNLRFTPLGRYHECINMIFIASRFQQLFGQFSGVIRLEDGRILNVEEIGIVEEHYAKW